MGSAHLTRTEQAADAIRQAISRGEYVSGERVVELTLARRLNVSQITIREALWILEEEGWIIKRARHGCFVRDFDARSASEVFLVYETLIDLIFNDIATRRLSRTQLKAMRACVQTARRALLNGDRSGAIGALFDSHVCLAQLSELALTGQLLTRVINQARLLESIRQARAPANVVELGAIIDRHDDMIEALAEGDDRARELLMSIVETYRQQITPLFAIA